jgi:hypothetical protein
VLLCADAAAASVGLAGGLLGLPIVQHRAAGAVGHGAERVIRLLDGAMARLRPDRARCWSCKRTHILLPAWYAPRRADAIEVIGTPQPQLRATPRTWWPTVPCGRSRPRSPPCAPSRSGCRSRRAGAIGGSWHAALGTLLWAGAGPRHRAAARHLERQLTVPCDRHPPVHHPPPRPGHQLVAAGPALTRRKLAQHAPFRPGLRPPWRRSPADRNLRCRHPHLRAPAWATSVHWPARACLESRRRDQGQHQPAPVLQTARR